VLRGISDPELPVLDIVELGIVQEVRVDAARVTVTVTPTFFGCPAFDWIVREIGARLEAAGFAGVAVRTVLSPPWTPSRIGPHGREKLRASGIALPSPAGGETAAPGCPRCGSEEVSQLAPFGATPCRSFWKCRHCLEPFEAIRPLDRESR
jgi:ring-1,2-phenylacetyl-CoA epoxidase subunit PaaD